MRSTRRRQLEQSRRSWALPHGPFGPVTIHAGGAARLAPVEVSSGGTMGAGHPAHFHHAGPAEVETMSMTAFFDYLHDHAATTGLAKALAEAAMLRTTGARDLRLPARREQIAS